MTLSAFRPSAFLRWARETFGPVATVRGERLLRFVEEAIELAHADGMERAVIDKLAERVFSRPRGDIAKEIGQAQACLEMFAENIGISSDAEAHREWERVRSIPQSEWERRHAAKQDIGIALPSSARGVPTEIEMETAIQYVLEKPSVSYLQRKMGIGYNHAKAIMEMFEIEGVVSKPTSSGVRTVLARVRPERESREARQLR